MTRSCMRRCAVHVARVANIRVKAGDQVTAGQPMAKVGNNGMSRHPHIHIGAWKGEEAMQIRFDLAAMAELLLKVR